MFGAEDEHDSIVDRTASDNAAGRTVTCPVQRLNLTRLNVHSLDAVSVKHIAGRITAHIIDQPSPSADQAPQFVRICPCRVRRVSCRGQADRVDMSHNLAWEAVLSAGP